MATATIPDPPITGAAVSAAPGLRLYRITVDVYERIVASGAFGDKSGVFLWKGQLVEKVSDMTKGRPHVVALNVLHELLGNVVHRQGYFVEQDQPITLSDQSMPEPDLKCVRGVFRDYAERTPTTHDCPLVVEVSDSSLEDDTGEMLRAYASAVVAVYWVVNIPNRRIDVYSEPTGPAESPTYSVLRSFGPDEDVPVVLDGREVGRIPVREVLP